MARLRIAAGSRAPRAPCFALACALAIPACKHEAPEPEAPPAPEVLVSPVEQRDVPIASEWLGTTEGLVNAEVRSRVQGYLISQDYVDGSEVKAGDLLFEVDPRPFEAALAGARADLSKARAEQGRTELDVARLAPLAPSGAVSQQEVDNARQTNEANKAAVEAAQAAVQQAELNLAFTKIISPIDGIAGFSLAQIGDLVGGPTGPVLTTVSTLDPIRVYIPISEQEYLRFQPRLQAGGRPREPGSVPQAELILGDGTVFPYKGTLDIVNRQVDPTTGTIRIAVRFPNPGNLLRPGQYARIRANVKTLKGALLVPQRAVVDRQGTYFVGVVAPDGTAGMRAVKVGERVGSDWVITEGLKPDEDVVVEGVQKIRDGEAVSAKPFVPPNPNPAAPAAQPAATGAAGAESGG